MTTTINLTPAEVAAWRVVPEGGTFRLVRDGEQWPCPPTTCDLNGNHPPAEFVQACAPCETCANPIAHMLMVGIIGRHDTCPARRIELVGPCPDCENPMLAPIPGRAKCRDGVLTLGWAYAVGQPQQTDDGKWELELRRA